MLNLRGGLKCFNERLWCRFSKDDLTVACLPYGSLVVPWLDAKLENNRESFELRKIQPASVDNGLGRVEHLVGEGGDLHQEGRHAWEESKDPWLLTEEIENPSPNTLFRHVGSTESEICQLKGFPSEAILFECVTQLCACHSGRNLSHRFVKDF